MSTLAEIEEAVVQLPPTEKEKLFAFLAAHLKHGQPLEPDPVAEIIGAFAGGEPYDTGRQAEDILYGRGEHGRTT